MEIERTPVRCLPYAKLIPASKTTALAISQYQRLNHNEHGIRYISASDDWFDEMSRHDHETADGADIDAFELNCDVPGSNPSQGWTLGRSSERDIVQHKPDFILTSPDDPEDYDLYSIHATLSVHPKSGLLTLTKPHEDCRVAIVEGGMTCSISHQETYTFVHQRTRVKLGGLIFTLIYQVPRQFVELQNLISKRDIWLDSLYPDIRNHLSPITRALYPPGNGFPISDHTYICKTIGRGGFGTVSLGIDRFNGNFVAVKTVVVQNEAELQDFEYEANLARGFEGAEGLLSSISHWPEPCCDPIPETRCFPFELSVSMPLILGDFHDRALFEQLSVKDQITLWSQALIGIDTLHTKGLMHRDISLANMAVVSLSPSRACLLDFGKTTHAKFALWVCLGPLIYGAPEVANLAKGKSDIPYYSAIDIWSFGYAWLLALGYEAGSRDWTSPQEFSRIERFLNEEEQASTEQYPLARFLRWILNPYPNFRPTAKQILEHKFWQQYDL